MTATAPRTTATGRLGNGELRRQVAAWLDENPGPCKPGDIAKALERSAGAVGNALKTLADRGEAELGPASPPGTRPTPPPRPQPAASPPRRHRPAAAPKPAPAAPPPAATASPAPGRPPRPPPPPRV